MAKRKIISALLLSVTMLFPMLAGSLVPETGVQAAGGYWPEGISIESESAIVLEQTTGTVLYAKNENEQQYPASITKIMTALLAIENCEMDEIVVFSPESIYNIEVGSSSIARDVGEELTMEQALYGMMLESANEVAYAIAEHVGDKYGGGYDKFIEMMNEKAAELGCSNTHFCNPHGLPEDDHYVSAYDMALIARAALEHNEFVKIIGTRRYTIPPTNRHSEEYNLNNQHGMFNAWRTTEYLYDYCIGGKTGYTDVARHTLVTYARKDGMTLVCVVLKSEGSMHYVDTTNLFNYCFDNFELSTISPSSDILKLAEGDKDTGALGRDIDLVRPEDGGTVVLPRTASLADTTSRIEPKSDPENPDVVGELTYTYADRTVGSANLLFTENVSEQYPFSNLSVREGEEPYIILDLWGIGRIVLLAAAGLLLLILIIKKLPGVQEKYYRFKNSHKRDSHNELIRIDRNRGRRRRR